MSSAAIANGGGVAAFSVVAALQSIGAIGLGTTTTAGVAGLCVGGGVGVVAGGLAGAAIGSWETVQEGVKSAWWWFVDAVETSIEKMKRATIDAALQWFVGVNNKSIVKGE